MGHHRREEDACHRLEHGACNGAGLGPRIAVAGAPIIFRGNARPEIAPFSKFLAPDRVVVVVVAVLVIDWARTPAAAVVELLVRDGGRGPEAEAVAVGGDVGRALGVCFGGQIEVPREEPRDRDVFFRSARPVVFHETRGVGHKGAEDRLGHGLVTERRRRAGQPQQVSVRRHKLHLRVGPFIARVHLRKGPRRLLFHERRVQKRAADVAAGLPHRVLDPPRPRAGSNKVDEVGVCRDRAVVPRGAKRRFGGAAVVRRLGLGVALEHEPVDVQLRRQLAKVTLLIFLALALSNNIFPVVLGKGGAVVLLNKLERPEEPRALVLAPVVVRVALPRQTAVGLARVLADAVERRDLFPVLRKAPGIGAFEAPHIGVGERVGGRQRHRATRGVHARRHLAPLGDRVLGRNAVALGPRLDERRRAAGGRGALALVVERLRRVQPHRLARRDVRLDRVAERVGRRHKTALEEQPALLDERVLALALELLHPAVVVRAGARAKGNVVLVLDDARDLAVRDEAAHIGRAEARARRLQGVRAAERDARLVEAVVIIIEPPHLRVDKQVALQLPLAVVGRCLGVHVFDDLVEIRLVVELAVAVWRRALDALAPRGHQNVGSDRCQVFRIVAGALDLEAHAAPVRLGMQEAELRRAAED